MAPSRRNSNGRSPLVNKQHQITAFFSKTPLSQKPPSSPPKPSPLSKLPTPNPNPNPKPKPSSSPNSSPPTTPSPLNAKSKPKTANSNPNPNPKPLLVIGSQPPSQSPADVGEEVVNRRIRVYWPLDKSWYEGCVKSFDKISGKHLVEYDDADEELLDLSKEKIEWIEGSVRKFKRLRKVSMVVDEDEDEDEEENQGNVGGVDDNDDSSDEDWGKNGVIEEEAESLEDMELEDEEKEETKSLKRKMADVGGGSKKVKDGRGLEDASVNKKKKSGFVLSDISSKLVKPVANGQDAKPANIVDNIGKLEASERFGGRQEQKMPFLDKDRRDANKRRPDDPNYDPKTLYLPPQFLKSLSGGQRQWWEFKSKNMDKVLFFKMGKFYELFEMDAHVGVKELDLQYMKGEQPHCGFPERNFSVNAEKLARKGYRVLVIEQTETPEQMEIRRREEGSKDKVQHGYDSENEESE